MQLVFSLLALIAVGLGLAWLVRRLLGGLAETSFIALLVMPLLIYGIASGAIAEFSGFGIVAKFNKAAETKVTELAGKLAIKAQIEDTNFKRSSLLQACNNYFVIKDDLGKRADKPDFPQFAYEVASAIKAAMLCPNFYGVVVIDKREHFLGLFQRERFEPLLAYPLDPYCIFNFDCNKKPAVSAVLAETELGVILKDPEIRVETVEATKHVVQESDSLVEIVKRPDFSQASVFAVLDRSGKFIGLLPKEAIYDKIFNVLLADR